MQSATGRFWQTTVHGLKEGGEVVQAAGSAIRKKHIIKRSFHAMIRGEPGTFHKKSRGARKRDEAKTKIDRSS